MSTKRSPFQTAQEQTPQPTVPNADADASQDEHFPSARYFEVHFEYLQETSQQMQQQLAELRLQMDRLNRKLERIHDAEDGEEFFRSA